MSEHVCPACARLHFSIARQARCLGHGSEYPCAISRADWGEILGSARTFGGVLEFPHV